jgi:hypothetical protein
MSRILQENNRLEGTRRLRYQRFCGTIQAGVFSTENLRSGTRHTVQVPKPGKELAFSSILMTKSIHFEFLIHRAMLGRGGISKATLKHVRHAATRIPEDVAAEDAANMFIRWLYQEPFQAYDSILLEMLETG